MNLEWGMILALVGANLFQTLYWSRMTHKLIDKLMSRNYAEYVQVEKLKHDLPHAEQTSLKEPDQDDDEDLERLNRTISGGMI